MGKKKRRNGSYNNTQSLAGTKRRRSDLEEIPDGCHHYEYRGEVPSSIQKYVLYASVPVSVHFY